MDEREVNYLQVLPCGVTASEEERPRRYLHEMARDEAPSASQVVMARSDDVVAEIVAQAADSDLLILGLQRLRRRHKVIGEHVIEIARRTTCPLMLISRMS